MHRNRRRDAVLFLLIGGLGVGLLGCNDPSVERGTPPTVALVPETVSIGLYGYGAALTLQAAIAGLAGPRGLGDVRATIDTVDRREAEAARVRLIDDGIQPASIRTEPASDNQIVLTRTVATVPDCARAMKPALFGDVSNSLDSLGRCVTADELAQSVVDPADLVHPVGLGPTDGAVAARAVLDWERGDNKQPPSGQNGSDSGNGTSGGGGVSGGPPAPSAAGASATAPATDAANPLLAPGL